MLTFCGCGCGGWVVGQGTAGILQICNTARHNVVILYVPIYHAFYYRNCRCYVPPLLLYPPVEM